MTIEEKARVYDEALEKVKPLYEQAKKDNNPIWSTYEYLVPQLAESEDERIRTALCDIVRDMPYMETELRAHGLTVEKTLAYLENLKEEEGYEAIPVKSTLEYKLGFKDGVDSERQKEQSTIPSRETILGIWELGNFWRENPEERGGLTQLQYIQKYWNEKCDYQTEQKIIECIEFDNEFENQVSHLLASVLNGEYEYNEGFVKHAAQSLLGYAKNEQKPAEIDEYEIIKKHITDDVLSSEVNKRLKECGWYVTDEKPAGATINGEPIPTENHSVDIPLAEWSEEDEKYLSQAIETLEHENYLVLAEKLKSLRPQQKDNKDISPKEGDIVVNKYGEISVFENWGHHPDGGSFNDKTYFFAKCTLDGDYYDDCDCYSDSDGLRYATPEEIRKIVPYLIKSFNTQPKTEWSEEDSDNLERVDNYLWMLDDYVGDDCAVPQGKTDKIRGNIQGILSPWLKSLPERFNLQPKQDKCPEYCVRSHCLGCSIYEKNKEQWLQWPVEGEFPYNTPADTIEGEIENIWNKLSCENRFTATKEGFREVLLHFVNYVRNNAASEWSEEDEKMRCNILNALTPNLVYSVGKGTSTGTSTYKYDKEIAWLKSLRPQPHTVSIKDATKFGNLEYERGVKDGIQSEKSRQWKPSELEKGALRTAIYILTEERNFPKAAGHLQAILDAFAGKESRKDWKPSEEQMEAFEKAVTFFKTKWTGAKVKEQLALESLYEDLKKLM